MNPEELKLPIAFIGGAAFFRRPDQETARTRFVPAIYASGATVTFRILAIIFNRKTRPVKAPVQSP